jgi:hypothetical protein
VIRCSSAILQISTWNVQESSVRSRSTKSLDFAYSHSFSYSWACHAPGLPCNDIGIIVKAQVLRGLIKLLKTINPWKCCNVSYGVDIINQILPPLQSLLQDTKESLCFIGISLQWVWVLALVSCILIEMSKLNFNPKGNN